MAVLPIHKYFVFNDEIRPGEVFIPGENEGGIYEVLRVVNGVPLFLEDHIDRLYNSALLARKNIRFSEPQIKTFIKNLIDRNKVLNGNVLISCNINLKAFFVPHNYPTELMYREGVSCGILKAERENPNAKVFQTTVRQRADKMLAEDGFYEVLLVDHLDRITEGSRSNIFFVKGNELVTSPGNKVLLGITRQKTLQMARDLKITITEREVDLSQLQHFDVAFITGTSPKILPIQKIEGFSFNPQNEIVRQLMKRYDDLIEEYLDQMLH
ncbi:MAG: aminotransferase class [Prolixibacteraceae bacterium]|nr:MAG: aminotransferase class [Prolixibacteraceae bacterium]